MARLRLELDGQKRSEMPVEQQIRPGVRLDWDYRYYLWDAYLIRTNRDGGFSVQRRLSDEQ